MTLVDDTPTPRALTLALVEAHYRTLIPEVPVIPISATTRHHLPCGHVFITYHAADSLTLRRHRKTCRGTKP